MNVRSPLTGDPQQNLECEEKIKENNSVIEEKSKTQSA